MLLTATCVERHTNRCQDSLITRLFRIALMDSGSNPPLAKLSIRARIAASFL